jgi:hypothetical protein
MTTTVQPSPEEELCNLYQEIATIVSELGPLPRVFQTIVNEELAAARRLLAALQALRDQELQ